GVREPGVGYIGDQAESRAGLRQEPHHPLMRQLAARFLEQLAKGRCQALRVDRVGPIRDELGPPDVVRDLRHELAQLLPVQRLRPDAVAGPQLAADLLRLGLLLAFPDLDMARPADEIGEAAPPPPGPVDLPPPPVARPQSA